MKLHIPHNVLVDLFHFRQHAHRNVALVLGGGGARGYAHIGAIEALLDHGYNITSVAGTSMGALVGGLFAAGKFDELKKIVLGVNRRQVISLVDISVGLDHIANGKRLVDLIDKMTDKAQIESLPINFCCVASDMTSGKERVFHEGSLSEAIRASISIPGLFSPVHIDGHVFVDGSVHNTLPLNRVSRTKGDLLVAVNASGPNEPTPLPAKKEKKDKKKGSGNLTLWRRLINKLPNHPHLSANYMSLATRVCEVVVENNTLMAKQLTPPDICVDVPTNRYGLLDFERGREIIAYGREQMEKQLAAYEKESSSWLDHLLKR